MTQPIREPHKEAPYISEADFFARGSVPSVDITIPNEPRYAGLAGATLKVQALPLPDRDKIHSGSRKGTGKVNEDGVMVYDVEGPMFTALTLVHGVVTPKFSIQKVQDLQRLNPAALEFVAAEIWDLSGIKPKKKGETTKNG